MKKEVDQVNIWFSPAINKWVMCCLLVKGELLKREKLTFNSLEEALAEADSKYKGRLK